MAGWEDDITRVVVPRRAWSYRVAVIDPRTRRVFGYNSTGDMPGDWARQARFVGFAPGMNRKRHVGNKAAVKSCFAMFKDVAVTGVKPGPSSTSHCPLRSWLAWFRTQVFNA
ncbi:hypothetical protein [Solilutibacter pythonis]|uniref:hypothetical protein n=1 Tax=Solilutibacter pythonis TaxID=2483112 RepID=UPI0011C421E4|nr:hypothetical protein [Lysobacter pythonis]